MKLTLKRIALKPTYTIGKLYIDDNYFCDTLEDTVRDLNKDGKFDNGEKKIKGKTAIPYGTYQIKWTYSPRFKKVSIYEILNKTVGELKEDWKNYFVDLHIKGSDYIVCKFDTLTEELMNYFKEFNIHSENNDDIIDTSSTEDGVEKKSAEEYVDDWLNDNDIDENRMKVIKELYSKYKEKI